MAAAKQAVAVGRKRIVLPFRRASEIRPTLQAVLRAAVPLSVIEIARRLGYTTTNSLYNADRTLCDKITARYQQSGGRSWWKKPDAPRTSDVRMKDLLEHSLRSDEPIPVHQITASLDIQMMRISADNFRSCASAIDRRIAQAKKDRFEKMGPILKTAIDENPVPSLAEVARRLGYSYTAIVQRHEPGLCEQLIERRRVYIASRRADLESQALAALKQSPPPSVRAVCRGLGITVRFMHEHFPTVERSIIGRRRSASAEKVPRRELAGSGIESIGTDSRRKAWGADFRVADHPL